MMTIPLVGVVPKLVAVAVQVEYAVAIEVAFAVVAGTAITLA